jgi:PAB1-binding protein PBP1
MEERGAQMDDSGMDEEDRYGAVVRDINPNKYMPPALRKQMQQQQQKQAGKTDAASGGESSDGKSDSKKTRSDNPLQKLSTSNLPKAGASPSPVSNLGNMRSDSAGVRGKVPANNKVRYYIIREENQISTCHLTMLTDDFLFSETGRR